jgi:hypothetical protein
MKAQTTHSLMMLLLGVILAWSAFGFERTQIPGSSGKAPPRLTAEQAAELVRQQVGGRVISIRPQADGYEVRLLTPRGRVLLIWVPSANR